eukprot:7691119-Pyramimonas_sp.AAC.1
MPSLLLGAATFSAEHKCEQCDRIQGSILKCSDQWTFSLVFHNEYLDGRQHWVEGCVSVVCAQLQNPYSPPLRPYCRRPTHRAAASYGTGNACRH